MVVLAVVGNLFYFWIAIAVLILLWIPVSHHGFKKHGKFMILPATGLVRTDSTGDSRRALTIFTAVRVAAAVLFIVLGLLNFNDRTATSSGVAAHPVQSTKLR